MKLRIYLDGKSYDVEVEFLDEPGGTLPRSAPMLPAPVAAAAPPPPPAAARPAPAAAAPAPAPAAAGGGANAFPSPIGGVVRGIKVKVGDQVAANQEVLILEAMKMETSIAAPRAGVVTRIAVNVGENVQPGQTLLEIQ